MPEPRFIAGLDVPTSLVRYQLDIPNTIWWIEALQQALAYLTGNSSWIASSTITQDTAADQGVGVVESLLPSLDLLGFIFPFAGDIAFAPDNVLPCDGASYLRSDFPDLFTVIQTIWGSADSSHFNVPDLRGRAPIGVGTGSGLSPRSLADSLGQETHVLTSTEMPSHVHGESVATPFLTVAPPVGVFVNAVPGIGLTGSAGGDGAHNTMQPSTAVNFVIVAQHT